MAQTVLPLQATAAVAHFFATRPAFTVASAICYVAVVAWLVHAIALQVRLESWVTRVAMTAIDPAPISAAETESARCGNVSGIERSVCNAEARFDLKRSKIKERVAARKTRVVPAASEPAAVSPDQAGATWLENGSVLEWASSVAVSSLEGERIPKTSSSLAAMR